MQNAPHHVSEGRGKESFAPSGNTVKPACNVLSPRLWKRLRKFNRNLKRVVRLQDENARLLEEMRHIQGLVTL